MEVVVVVTGGAADVVVTTVVVCAGDVTVSVFVGAVTVSVLVGAVTVWVLVTVVVDPLVVLESAGVVASVAVGVVFCDVSVRVVLKMPPPVVVGPELVPVRVWLTPLATLWMPPTRTLRPRQWPRRRPQPSTLTTATASAWG